MKLKFFEINLTQKSQQEGITLIALVLTIIVMLILAGVTINLTLGQNRHIYNSTKSSTKLYSGTK